MPAIQGQFFYWTIARPPPQRELSEWRAVDRDWNHFAWSRHRSARRGRELTSSQEHHLKLVPGTEFEVTAATTCTTFALVYDIASASR